MRGHLDQISVSSDGAPAWGLHDGYIFYRPGASGKWSRAPGQQQSPSSSSSLSPSSSPSPSSSEHRHRRHRSAAPSSSSSSSPSSSSPSSSIASHHHHHHRRHRHRRHRRRHRRRPRRHHLAAFAGSSEKGCPARRCQGSPRRPRRRPLQRPAASGAGAESKACRLRGTGGVRRAGRARPCATSRSRRLQTARLAFVSGMPRWGCPAKLAEELLQGPPSPPLRNELLTELFFDGDADGGGAAGGRRRRGSASMSWLTPLANLVRRPPVCAPDDLGRRRDHTSEVPLCLWRVRLCLWRA